jgi:Holliday junction DNA helicase RuvA
MLSSLSPNEIEEAILGGAVGVLQGVKGIGLKTAQRVIVDLKDKVGKTKDDSFKLMFEQDQQVYQESESALISLGFNKKQVEKVLKAIIKINPEITVEDMIKAALRQL